METVIVALCVLAALVYMGRSMYLRMTRKGGGCGCGCGGCGSRNSVRDGRPGAKADAAFEPPSCCVGNGRERRG